MGCCLWGSWLSREGGGGVFMWWYSPDSHAFHNSYRISFFSNWPSLSNVPDIAMGSWKTYVRARLQERDLNEKLPFVGVYTSCTQMSHVVLSDDAMRALMLTWIICCCCFLVFELEERYEVRNRIVDDMLSDRYDGFADTMLLSWRLWKKNTASYLLFIFLVNLSQAELRFGEINSSIRNCRKANIWLKRSD